MGLWKVLEYERASGRRIKQWRFQNFSEAEEFRRKREEFYSMIGVDKERSFTHALPEISKAEIDMFTRIIESPELLHHVMRCFNAVRKPDQSPRHKGISQQLLTLDFLPVT